MARLFGMFPGAMIGLLACLASSAWAAEKKPNVLFLFTDDQRADGIAALGNPAVKTPNLDTLVKEGFTFRNAYCLGANVGAVCTPSRNMLLSGKAYFRWKGPQAPGEGLNFPVSMSRAGYETYHHGKRGNTSQNIQKKFDHDKYIQEQKERTGGQPSKVIVDEAIAFLKDRKKDRPFFAYLAFEGPHDPRVAAKEYLDLYERDKIPLPKSFLPVHPFDNGEMVVRDEKLASWPRTEAEVRKHLHDYYAVITAMDTHIGRLLKYLKDSGEYDNTLIVFSSDHGLAIGSHGLMGKQNLYEDGMKVPLIFSGPGVKKGSSEALAYLFDIYPTVSDMVGAKVPDDLDGKSLWPVMQGKREGVRDTLFLAYRDAQRAVRDRRWKMIRYPLINKTQLFDLETDPHETKDLAGDSTQAKRVETLLAEMKRWQKQLGDTAPLTSDKPRDPKFTPPKGG